MSLAKITLIGFYNAYDDSDPIFENLTLPDGIDKDLFINSLLLDAGEFEVLYADPDFFKNAISIWGRKWYRTFEKWYNALQVSYDPLNNYDRTEEWTTEASSNSSSNSNSNTNIETELSDSGTTQNTTNKSAYDSSALTPYESISGTSSLTSSGTNTERSSNDIVNSDDKNEYRKGRAYGNIGVTTSQQMLQSELELQEWNLYQHMIDLFKTELLIPIY